MRRRAFAFLGFCGLAKAATKPSVFQIRGIDRVPQTASVPAVMTDGTTKLAAVGPGLVLANDPNGILTLQSTAGIRFADAETPQGNVDGQNSVFTLANPPSPPASLALFRSGLRLRTGNDFTLDGLTVRFLPGSVPMAGDTLEADYRF